MSDKTTLFTIFLFRLPVRAAAVFLLTVLTLTGCLEGPSPEAGPTITLPPAPAPPDATSEAMAAYPPPVSVYPGPS